MKPITIILLLAPVLISCRYENVTHNTPEYYGGGSFTSEPIPTSPEATPVPEPATALLLGGGLILMRRIKL